ncbi:acetyl esterase/lipase [Chitinophaga dinghuensis]|uniref:Acetyl esterase/lipase n=1 Tax=Chitinophaga dinghuensis TaxID=1539050 RepID=A0A327VWP7_9BACT|nr:alpha/beta hydrolase [Chitinophaga dinghuensis]RAJ80369.1 acetyl esterase/lipase [Chitinophaga dinghuensis]
MKITCTYKRIGIIFCGLLSAITLHAQQWLPLYPDTVVNSRHTPNLEIETAKNNSVSFEKVTVPMVQLFLPSPEKANGAAMVICPGGGYANLAYSKEGSDFAQKLNSFGITCIVLKYRLPNDTTMWNRNIGPLQDVQQAIKLARLHAADWKLDTNRIGLMGSSAGGHLAATAATHAQHSYIPNPEGVRLRPDFLVLVYPVISMEDGLTHPGSKNKLIGADASPAKVKEFSNEWQVSANTPPTFLVHATDDNLVPVANSIAFYSALVKQHVPAEIHIYQRGGHGFGMRNSNPEEHWMDRLEHWLKDNKWLDK